MKVKITIDDRSLKRDLKKFTEALNKEASESIVEIAQISCRQMATRIEPFGLDKKAQLVSEKAIYKDISKAYWTNPQTYNAIKKINPKLALAYGAAIKRNDLIKAEEIADKVIRNFSIGSYDSGSHLKESRNKHGRVTKASPLNIGYGKELDQLRASIVLSAGNAKAGFLQCASSLGSKGRIAKWLKKTHKLGTSQIIKNGWKSIVTITNHCHYINNVITDTKVQESIRNAYRNQIKRLQKQLEALAKKA